MRRGHLPLPARSGGCDDAPMPRLWASITATVVLTAATTASGVVVAPVAGGARSADCSPATGAGRSALGVAGLPERAPGSWAPRLSADGRYVSFVSQEDGLVVGDTDQQADVFRMDRASGRILQVSVDLPGPAQRYAAEASMSQDGNRVAFSSSYQVY